MNGVDKLGALFTALEGRPETERQTAFVFMLGYVQSDVPAAAWFAGIEATLKQLDQTDARA